LSRKGVRSWFEGMEGGGALKASGKGRLRQDNGGGKKKKKRRAILGKEKGGLFCGKFRGI